MKKKVLQFLGNTIVKYLVNVLCKTIKINEINKESIHALERDEQNYVLAFWHGTMLLPWYLFRNKNLSAIVSKSKDGEILTKVLKMWNYDVQRGSSNKAGKEVLNNLIEKANNKYSVAITPDGPKGPAKQMKAGAVIIAKKTNVPLVLVGIGFKKKKILSKSWDKFQIPNLFTKAYAVYSKPIFIDRNLSYEETDAKIKEAEKELNYLQKQAEQYC